MTDISIRSIHPDDFERWQEIVKDPEIQKLTLFSGAREKQEAPWVTFENLLKADNKGWYRSYTVFDDGKAVGCLCDVSSEKAPDIYWLGCWVAAEARGRRIASRALSTLTAQIRAENSRKGVRASFRAAVRLDNKNSLRLMDKLGFEVVPEQENAPKSADPVRHFILS